MAGLNNDALEYPFLELAKCRRFAHFRVFRRNNILCGEGLRCTENVLQYHFCIFVVALNNVLCLYTLFTFILAMTRTVLVTFEAECCKFKYFLWK